MIVGFGKWNEETEIVAIGEKGEVSLISLQSLKIKEKLASISNCLVVAFFVGTDSNSHLQVIMGISDNQVYIIKSDSLVKVSLIDF